MSEPRRRGGTSERAFAGGDDRDGESFAFRPAGMGRRRAATVWRGGFDGGRARG